MDVAAPRLPDSSPDPTFTQVPRFARPPAPPPADPARDGPRLDRLPKPSERWTPPSTLKFSLHAADVTAKFEIHEGTRQVTVTMLDRNTGEVLREVPSRRVLDQIAALESSGLRVDVRS